MSFKSLGLSSTLLDAIKKVGFQNPTEIQSLVIPKILESKNLLIEAQTGTGKTASFVLPILEKLKDVPLEKKIKVLVLSPTRELAIQTTGIFFRFAQHIPHKLSFLSVIGGESINSQNKTLSFGVEVIVATPGRLLDLIAQNTVDLSHLELLVIDEADKILDQGFSIELDMLLQKIPSKRQNLFFSATYPEKVNELVKRLCDSVEIIKLEEVSPTVENITQRVIEVNKDNRSKLLRHLIESNNWKHVLVFVGSKTHARNLALKLQKYNITSGALHGDLSQMERNLVLSDFKAKKLTTLISTDIAARGIDITKLEVVINFDLPRSPADYIHRIGRTGRAQELGHAISFIDYEDFDHFKLIEKRAGINLTRESITGFEISGELPKKIKGGAPIKGKRKSKKDKLREKIIIHEG
jgi:superfamily II DNA/RNA helicase